ncbi:Rap1a/Tai family immunity protein [Mesorhizobium newzealandense]|uniref:Rap1a/Tai family immunity protein n=1 Tax=Mesorhizobium newzealandense TaxID=1300302 RepID=A0ABW4UKI2_9HYPH
MRRSNASATAILIGLALVVDSTGAHAGAFVDGNGMNEYCTSRGEGGRLVARGYAMAAADEQGAGVAAIGAATGNPLTAKRLVCVPNGVTDKQAEDVLCNYLATHPESRQRNAFTLAIVALWEAWPCSKR